MSKKFNKYNLDLNPIETVGKFVQPKFEYELDPTNKYIISVQHELSTTQSVILQSINKYAQSRNEQLKRREIPFMYDYWNWLTKNGFNDVQPNPTNEFVSQFYGVAPLWKTTNSQGIVVKAIEDDDYYIVLECSRNNIGFKYTKILLTPGGCM